MFHFTDKNSVDFRRRLRLLF